MVHSPAAAAAAAPPDLSPELQAELIATAHALADVARVETLKYFRAPGLDADNKSSSHFDPVTVADRACEKAMRDLLAERRPMDAVLGEEQDATPGTSGLTWVLDPIDGTRGFLTGTPVWGVLIGLRDAERVLYGIIDQPHIGERFEGGFGRACVSGPHGQRTLATGPRRTLAEARMFSTFPEVGTPAEAAAFRRLVGQVRLTRYGLDCYGYALVAAGQADIVVEAGLNSYDVLAPIAVIEAAGGIVSDWKGAPVLDGGQVLAAANADLHRAALEVLGEAGG
ncbi:inositol monophosphatase family protein [Frigidibacter sp. ROC022]|uniref:inositol monophosphatase family protein n=1 Tax=Frigidibacter sp. ROC022 TaxID=2971796 RepID=UPI00215B5915|nr:inositol monophosphatase family protein [Frigidibacter sp. ROC022]MCR8726757.1 inositol monophosphatase family protein [Frigidibacter sp. ROC022]